MKRRTLTILLTMAMTVAMLASLTPAATPMNGAQRAKAGTGGVTIRTFVKLSAADTIVAATAVTDKVIGICEQTAVVNAITKYAPMGTRTVVTSGEAIVVGDLLTTGTGGKAFVLDTDDASTQRYAAVALTAAGSADVNVTVLLQAGVVEQPNDRADMTADTVTADDATTPYVSTATGKTNTGYLEVKGKTSGSIRVTCADATAFDVKFAIPAQTTSDANYLFPDLGGSDDTATFIALTQTLTNKTIDGDDNTVQDIAPAALKILTNDTAPGIPFVQHVVVTGAGSTDYTIPSGKKLRVLDVHAYKASTAGGASDTVQVLSTANAITDAISLNVSDKVRVIASTLDDAYSDIAAAGILRVTGVQGTTDCQARVSILCVWVTP